MDRRAEDGADPDRTHGGAVPPPRRPEPRAPAAPPAPPPERDELADLEKSVWDLGLPPAAHPEPSLSPAPPRPVAPVRRPALSVPSAPARVPAPPPAAGAPARAATSPTAASPPATSTAPATAAPVPMPPAAAPGHPAPAPRPAAAAARPGAPAPSHPVPAPPRPGPAGAARLAAPRAPAVHGREASPDGVVEVHVRRPEPWRRAAAWVIDVIPFLAGGAALVRLFVREAAAGAGAASGLDLLDFVARERVIVLSVAAAMVVALGVYVTLAHALAGATLGKRLLRLRVVGPDGERPALARSAARSALAVVSVAALGLGFLLALFTASGRALHDLLARTWVVDAQP